MSSEAYSIMNARSLMSMTEYPVFSAKHLLPGKLTGAWCPVPGNQCLMTGAWMTSDW